MKKGICALFICLFVMGALPVFAEMRFTTADGKVVICRDNGTWIYETPSTDAAQTATVTVHNKRSFIIDAKLIYWVNGQETTKTVKNITANKKRIFTIPAEAEMKNGGFKFRMQLTAGSGDYNHSGNLNVKPGENYQVTIKGSVLFKGIDVDWH